MFNEIDVAAASTGTCVETEAAAPVPVMVQMPLVVGVHVVAPNPALFKEMGNAREAELEEAVKVTDVEPALGTNTFSGCETPTIALAVAAYGAGTLRGAPEAGIARTKDAAARTVAAREDRFNIMSP